MIVSSPMGTEEVRFRRENKFLVLPMILIGINFLLSFNFIFLLFLIKNPLTGAQM